MNSKKILIVDDDYAFGEFAKVLLDFLGYSTVLCSEPLEAEELAEKEKPDLVLMDVSMPGLTGVDLIKRFKARSEIKNVPIVLCSITKNASEVSEAFELGAAEFLRKPLEQERLKACIRRVLK